MAGSVPGAVAGAERLLAAAVADALAVLAPDATEKVSDFAMQTALFAVGAPFFIAAPDTDMAGWIGSMPDEALDGLRNSMVETARAMGRHEDAARIANEPKEALASILAESAPKAASGIIADLDAGRFYRRRERTSGPAGRSPPGSCLPTLRAPRCATSEAWRRVERDW